MSKFFFGDDFDVKTEVFKATQTVLSADSLVKFNEGYYFPVVENWLKVKLKTIIQSDVFHIDEFVTCTSVNRSPTNFCLTLEFLLNLRFSEEVLKDYEDEYNGIELY